MSYIFESYLKNMLSEKLVFVKSILCAKLCVGAGEEEGGGKVLGPRAHSLEEGANRERSQSHLTWQRSEAQGAASPGN